MEEKTYYDTENEVIDTFEEADDGITAGKVAEGAGIVAVAGLAIYGAFTGGKKIFNFIKSKVKKNDSEDSESKNSEKK